MYADPQWAPTGWSDFARTREGGPGRRPSPVHGFQLAWARAYVGVGPIRGGPGGAARLAGRRPACPTVCRSTPSCAGRCCSRWSPTGAAGSAEIEAELAGDRTASGEREAARARALIPTAENKAEVWERLTGEEALPNWLHRSLLQGFQHPAQVELTAPYATKFFESVGEVWARRDSEPAQEFVMMAYPAYQISQDTVAQTDAWLAARRASRVAAPAGRRGPRRGGPGAQGTGPGRRCGLSRGRDRVPRALRRAGDTPFSADCLVRTH